MSGIGEIFSILGEQMLVKGLEELIGNDRDLNEEKESLDY